MMEHTEELKKEMTFDQIVDIARKTTPDVTESEDEDDTLSNMLNDASKHATIERQFTKHFNKLKKSTTKLKATRLKRDKKKKHLKKMKKR